MAIVNVKLPDMDDKFSYAFNMPLIQWFLGITGNPDFCDIWL